MELAGMTVQQLRKVARDCGLSTTSLTRKTDLILAINRQRQVTDAALVSLREKLASGLPHRDIYSTLVAEFAERKGNAMTDTTTTQPIDPTYPSGRVEEPWESDVMADNPQLRADQLADSLRRVATMIADHPEAVNLWDRWLGYLYFYASEEGEIRQFIDSVKGVARQSIGGDPGVRKSFSPSYACVHGVIGVIQMQVATARDNVCERRVVGTELVTEEVPDPNAPLIVREVSREIVEWDCKPLLRD